MSVSQSLYTKHTGGLCFFIPLIMKMGILNIPSTELHIRDERRTIVSLAEFSHGFLKLNAEMVTHTLCP